MNGKKVRRRNEKSQCAHRLHALTNDAYREKAIEFTILFSLQTIDVLNLKKKNSINNYPSIE